ncbi:MAG: beta-lactamase family protein [Burkholderiales bacterium]|nr:beta-lactamase family protein [Burkholderiales bacterium]MBK8667720.1 beta-lactamase family protein [Burkholderiales bacterium]
MRWFVLFCGLLAAAPAFAQVAPPEREATPDERRRDAAAFAGLDQEIREQLADVQSVVVMRQGRVVYRFYRDGNPEALRDTQSVAKSALAMLVGTALRQGHIASLDQPVLQFMPHWQALNPDPRAEAITLRHLLSMTAGFDVDDPSGTAAALEPTPAWSRPLRAPAGQRFAYDNSGPTLVTAILEHVTGQKLPDYARAQLVQPMGLAEPGYTHGGRLSLRTVDMARLGQLMLQQGQWNGQPLLSAEVAAQMMAPQSAGGPPVGLPYGLGWWVPSATTFFASGYGGQFIWVHPPLALVVATTATVSPGSQQRAQATQLVRGRLFQAARRHASE